MFIEETVSDLENNLKNEIVEKIISIDKPNDVDPRNGSNDLNIDDMITVNGKSQIDEIWEIIDNLNNETDLNSLIESINKVRLKLNNKKIFDKNKMTVSFNNNEVDKFSNAKDMHKNFSVEVNFQLI